MKKLYLLLIVAMLATSLVAANPAGKLVRLEIINNSGDVIYMKLEGKYTGAFYYLTVQDEDDVTFTVLTDEYKRTTWACNGVKSTGKLVMNSNARLNFTSCNAGVPLRTVFSTNVAGTEFAFLRYPNFGEPTMEKVFYMKAYTNYKFSNCGDPFFFGCNIGTDLDPWYVHWVMIKYTTPDLRTYKVPQGLFYRYRY